MTYRWPIIAAVPIFCLSACGSVEHEDIKGWMREQAQSMRGKVPPLPEVPVFQSIPYGATELTSPFSTAKIIAIEAAADKTAPDRFRPRQPLESFPLEDLRLTGIIVDGKNPYALVQTPAPNKPKQIRVGEYIGQNYGRVISIEIKDRQGQVMVRETVKDNNGAWMERDVLLTTELLPGGKR